jgi:hypothetical protein
VASRHTHPHKKAKRLNKKYKKRKEGKINKYADASDMLH